MPPRKLLLSRLIASNLHAVCYYSLRINCNDKMLRKENINMAFTFPKITSFDTPEGDYRAVVRNAFEMKDGALRIVFEILSLDHCALTFVAGKSYAPGKQAVADDLFDWLGLAGVQEILNTDRTIDAAKLKGRFADIRVTHITNDDYEKPFVFVSEINPPGALTPEFQSAA